MKNERKKGLCNNVALIFISIIIKFYFYISIFCKCNFKNKIVKLGKKLGKKKIRKMKKNGIII